MLLISLLLSIRYQASQGKFLCLMELFCMTMCHRPDHHKSKSQSALCLVNCLFQVHEIPCAFGNSKKSGNRAFI